MSHDGCTAKQPEQLMPTPVLAEALSEMFERPGWRPPVRIVGRAYSQFSTTFPSEVVRCRFSDGSTLPVFCKYSEAEFYTGHGHRGGVPYESEVYRRVLEPSGFSVPAFYGVHNNLEPRITCLAIEYLGRSIAAGKLSGLRGMKAAARWIGAFHAYHGQNGNRRAGVLKEYDAGYYSGWVRRTRRFAGGWRQTFPWLSKLCRSLEKSLEPLTAADPTVVHGEFYPHNILFHRGRVRPVDWESAAIGPGEIDLACLTEGWPAAICQMLIREYQGVRWPHGAPAEFETVLDYAQLYLAFRWLGDAPEVTARKHTRWYFRHIQKIAQRLELL